MGQGVLLLCGGTYSQLNNKDVDDRQLDRQLDSHDQIDRLVDSQIGRQVYSQIGRQVDSHIDRRR